MDQHQSPTPELKNQADAVLYFISRLDIDMVNDILDDTLTYQDMHKDRFINKIESAFNKFIDAGDTCLTLYQGCCDSRECNFKCSGYRFVVSNSCMYMDLIVEIKDGEVKDLYECTEFLCTAPFGTISTRVRIDRLVFPFD